MGCVRIRLVISSDLSKNISKSVNKNFDSQVKFLSKMVKTKSVNTSEPGCSSPKDPVEAEVAELIYKKLSSMGLSPRRMGASKKRPNIVCNFGPKRYRKSLILNGHMDTVAATGDGKIKPFSGTVRGDRLYGVGALDMKGTLSAYIYAVKAIQDMGIDLEGKLTLAFVVDEEAGACSEWGTKYLLSRGIKAKAAIVGEPGTHTIAIGHRGGYRFRLSTFGESVHTGLSLWEKKKMGRNAILDMMDVVKVLQKLEIPFKSARVFPGRKPVFTFPTKIVGGRSINEVPDRCDAYGDVRLMPGHSGSQVKIWIEDRLSKIPGLKFEIEDLLFVPAVEIDSKEEIVVKLGENAGEVLGKKLRVRGVGPWNSAWMYITNDVPAIGGFGPDGENPHQENEWVSLNSLKKVTRIYTMTILDYLGIKEVE